MGLGLPFVQPPSAWGVAGFLQNFYVTAYDRFGNVADDSTTLGVTITDPAAIAPTTTVLSHGSGSFYIFWETAGNQLLTITDLNDPSMTLATPWGVTAGPVVRLQIVGPATVTAGVPAPFTIKAFDAYNNPTTFFLPPRGLSTPDSVHFSSSDLQAGLPADYAFTAGDEGGHTFNVILGTAGPQSVSVRLTQSLTLVSSVIGVVVTPGSIGRFAVTSTPSTTAGVGQTFTVSAQDAFGNALRNYTGTVTFSSSDVQAGLPANYTFTAADAGVHTFTATLKTAGAQSVTVNDTAVPTAAGTTGLISVVAAGAARFTIAAPATAVAGQSFTVTVTAFDAFGNLATGYRGKVHFTDTAGNSGLPSDYSFSAADSGVHVFTLTLTTAGAQTLTIADVANALVKGGAGLTVSPKPSGGGKG